MLLLSEKKIDQNKAQQEKITVLLATSEVASLAQTGGLAEVCNSLSKALIDKGINVSLVMPAYKTALENIGAYKEINLDLRVDLGAKTIKAKVLKGFLDSKVPVYFIEYDPFFNRPNLYGLPQGGDYSDNAERFIFFSKAVLAMLPSLDVKPDIIWSHDWQTALIMLFLNENKDKLPKGMFTVHNLGFLGLFPLEKKELTGLPDTYFSFKTLEYYGQMSLLKAGLIYSQVITTVSPSYAQEIQMPEAGHGLDGVMRQYNHKLNGVLNGVDYNVWNPEVDGFLPANYTANDLSGKKICKKFLLKELELPATAIDKPVLGMVTRLTPQKGISLLREAADEIFNMGAILVVLGSGDSHHEKMMMELKEKYPNNVGLRLGFDVNLSHLIIAGSDFLLMPSLYEPCGLAQIYALKYGTLPIVRSVGGLNDTVSDLAGKNQPGGEDTGFKFFQFHVVALLRAIRRALEAYDNPEKLNPLMQRAMKQDFSWERSADEYIELFKKILT